MYAKVKSGVVEAFPYGLRDLARDNPNTSFPKIMSNAALAEHDIYPVVAKEVQQPFDAITQNATVVDPVFDGKDWVQTWIITPATAEEVQQRTAELVEGVRYKRNTLLAESDWTQVADAPVDATAWATYRQALRDITDHVNFPYLADEDWPVKPV